MTTDAQTGDYRSFLEAQDVGTLRDWAAYDPIDAIRELGHLVTHFREEAADPEVADLLRVRYVDYLVEHADDRRFDRRTGSPHPGTG